MVLVVLLGIALGAFVWRASQGPIEIGFAKKFIESELSDPSHNISLRVGQVFLSWSPHERRPEVALKNVSLFNTQQNRLVFSFESAEVSFSRVSMLLGHIEPRSIVIDKPLIRIVRDQSNHLSLALDQKSDEATEDKKIDVFEILDQLSQSPRDMPHGWPLRSLKMIAITNARLMVEDHVLNQSWLAPKIELSMRRSDQGVETTASLWLESENIKEPSLQAKASYISKKRNIVANLTLNDLRASFLATRFPDLAWLKDQVVKLDGQAQAEIDANMNLVSLQASLQSARGLISVPDVYDKPIMYQSLALNVAYDAAQKTLIIRDSPVIFTDDFSVVLSGALNQISDDTFSAPLRVHINTLSQSRLAEYWPAVLRGDPSEEWALKRLSQGRLLDSNINVTLDIARKQDAADADHKEWSVNLAYLKTDFNFDGMRIDYREPLMPVTEAAGRGEYDYKVDRLVVDVTDAKLGNLDIKSGKVIINTVAGKEVGHASIDINVSGPVKTLLTYISEDPINVKIPTNIARVEGVAGLSVNVSFPTLAVLPAEEIDVTADGTMDKVFMPGLVHDLDVTGGPMTLKVKDRRVDVAGKAKLDGYDTDFTFDQYFESKNHDYSGRVIANIVADEALRKKFGVDLSDWIQGAAPAKVTYTDFGGGRAQVEVDVDATPATLTVKPMNYTKSPGVAARITALALLDHGNLTDVQKLNIDSADAKVVNGQMTFVTSGKETLLRKGFFPSAKLLESDVAITIDVPQPKQIVMDVKGAFIDATPFLENNKKAEDYTGPAFNVTANVQKMRTSKTQSVTAARVLFNMDQTGTMNLLQFDAKVGRGHVDFRYKPDLSGQKMTLTIDADDAGAVLQAFDVYENARGGTLSISGESAVGGDRGVIIGKAEMEHFKVVNAPVLARLVNALSLPGILQLLSSDGITFTRLESDFTWSKKKGGDIIVVKNGRTSGTSMGLTFDGHIDRIQDQLNITGTIVPVSLVNDVIGGIPLIGDILSGGSKGGVFAATYSVRGPTKEPTTTVNPLSILTPGFLRQIFFE